MVVTHSKKLWVSWVCSHSFMAPRFNRNATLGRRFELVSAPALCPIYVRHICLEPLAGLDCARYANWVRQLYPQGAQEPTVRRQQRYSRHPRKSCTEICKALYKLRELPHLRENITVGCYLSKFLMDAGGDVSNYEKGHSSYRNSKDFSSVRKISSGLGTGSILGTETETAGRTNHSRLWLSVTKTRGLQLPC